MLTAAPNFFDIHFWKIRNSLNNSITEEWRNATLSNKYVEKICFLDAQIFFTDEICLVYKTQKSEVSEILR